jgi:hypothetical protein
MRQSLILSLGCLLIFNSCKQKEKSNKEKNFPVLSFLKSQVAHVDTSLYSIRRVVYVDSVHSDTTYISRENFKDAAHDFLLLPDISDPKYADRYNEDKQFDETLNRFLIVYTPVNPDKEIIQREEILIKSEPPTDKVTNFIINTIVNTKDSLIEKKMLWKVDESFQVTTTSQKPGQAEVTTTYKVVWNESDSE